MVDIKINSLHLLAAAYEDDDEETHEQDDLIDCRDSLKLNTNECQEQNEEVIHFDLHKELDYECGEEKASNSKKLKVNQDDRLLPVPDVVNAMYKDSSTETDNPDLHEGRTRSFPHKRGNWTSFVYIPFKCLRNGGVKRVYNYINSSLEPNSPIQRILEPHLSLSKTVVLRHHWIDSFILSLQKRLVTCNINIEHFVLDTLEIYVNEEKTRTFLGMKVLPTKPLLELVESCDFCLSEYNLESYYKNPSFHISFAWMIGDQSESTIFRNYTQSVCSYWNKLHDNDPSLRTLNVHTVELKTGHNIYQFRLKVK